MPENRITKQILGINRRAEHVTGVRQKHGKDKLIVTGTGTGQEINVWR